MTLRLWAPRIGWSMLSRWAVAAVVWVMATMPMAGQMVTVGDGGPGPVKAQHLTAELQTTANVVRPGAAVDAGLVITLEQGWHVYWINAGDAGEPPAIAWTLPKGMTASALEFPIPTRLPLQSLMDFGYEDGVTLPFRVSVAKSVKPGAAHLGAMVTWVVCREVCVPGKGADGAGYAGERGSAKRAGADGGGSGRGAVAVAEAVARGGEGVGDGRGEGLCRDVDDRW